MGSRKIEFTKFSMVRGGVFSLVVDDPYKLDKLDIIEFEACPHVTHVFRWVRTEEKPPA